MVDSLCLTVRIICQFRFQKVKFQKWSQYSNHLQACLNSSTWKLRIESCTQKYPESVHIIQAGWFQLSVKFGIQTAKTTIWCTPIFMCVEWCFKAECKSYLRIFSLYSQYFHCIPCIFHVFPVFSLYSQRFPCIPMFSPYSLCFHCIPYVLLEISISRW